MIIKLNKAHKLVFEPCPDSIEASVFLSRGGGFLSIQQGKDSIHIPIPCLSEFIQAIRKATICTKRSERDGQGNKGNASVDHRP